MAIWTLTSTMLLGQMSPLHQRWFIFVARIPDYFFGLLIILAGFVVSIFVSRSIKSGGGLVGADPSLLGLLAGFARFAVIVIAAIMGLSTMGIDTSGLLTGLGLTGFAVGFALKDALSNLMSGIFVLYFHPFDVGDQIEVAGKQGKVTHINLRYTVLHDGDSKVLIPNTTIITQPLRVTEIKQPDGSTEKPTPENDKELAEK